MEQYIDAEQQMKYLSEAIIYKFKNELRKKLRKEIETISEKVLNETIEKVSEEIDLDAYGAIHMSMPSSYAKIVVEVKDKR